MTTTKTTTLETKESRPAVEKVKLLLLKTHILKRSHDLTDGSLCVVERRRGGGWFGLGRNLIYWLVRCVAAVAAAVI